jgi:uncharacterized membrane protein
MKLKTSTYLFILLAVFGIIYALISLVNHYYFRTYALDLGLYTNALYKYAHFQAADSTMIKKINESLLGDHFDIYLVIFSPLVYLFGTYTLLIIQVAAILLGGTGIYKYFRFTVPGNDLIPLAAAISFFSFFGIYSALAFDYHSNVVAAMLVPWFFLFFRKKNLLVSSILVALILVAKENMALWMIFICFGMLIEYRKDRRARLFLGGYAVFSLVYFLVILQVVMPWINISGKYNGFSYAILGQTPMEALQNIILHPVDSFRTLFLNTNSVPYGNYVKTELHVVVLLSGLYLLILKPRYLIMLIPIYFQKMFHDSILMWSIADQYSIEFAPILAIGMFSAIAEFKNPKIERVLCLIAFIGILFSTIHVMDRTVIYTNKSKVRFYTAGHYRRSFDVKSVYNQLDKLPPDAAVSALSPLVPHLALRDHIYQFPNIRDAEYIVYTVKEDKYPMNEASFTQLIEKLKSEGEWEEWSKNDEVVVLRKMKNEK